jgi:hypothetical protein
MKDILIPQRVAGASDGMLPTTSCSLPSSSGISFLRLATDGRKEKRLLPFGGLARSIKPRIGRLPWTSKGGNDLGGGKLGKRFGEGHGQTIPKKEMSSMQKINLAPCLQCGHGSGMSNTNQQTASFAKVFGPSEKGWPMVIGESFTYFASMKEAIAAAEAHNSKR